MPWDFAGSNTGAAAARRWFRSWCEDPCREPGFLGNVYNTLKRKHLEALVQGHEFAKKYPGISKTAVTRAMHLCSEARLVGLAGDAWGQLDIQPRFNATDGGVFGGMVEVVYAQVWLQDDVADALPFVVLRSNLGTQACAVMISEERQALGGHWLGKLWPAGFVQLSPPSVQVVDFTLDVWDFCQRAGLLRADTAAMTPINDDFGAGSYCS